jgi:hypothetical protein
MSTKNLFTKTFSILIAVLCFAQIAAAQTETPYIDLVYPSPIKKGATVTIQGFGFTGTTTVSFGGVQISSFTIVDDYDITAVLDSAASGEVDVINPAGTGTFEGFIFIDSACTAYTLTPITKVSVCDKSFPYTWSWNGVTYPGVGNYTVHATDIYGCDSIFTLQLTTSGPCTWSPLGGANSLQAKSLIFSIIADSLNNIYAAGDIPDSNGTYYVAKWNGTNWSELGGNSLAANGTIKSLCTDKKGNLYAAGSFRNINGHSYVAKWNGNTWSELGDLDSMAIYSIRSVCSDKAGNIYAASWSPDSSGNYYIAKWDGTSWSELGGFNSLAANSLPWAVCADKAGNIYTGGEFTNGSDDLSGNLYVAKWDGKHWSELGGANSFAADIVANSPYAPDPDILYLCTDTASNVYVAGDFADTTGHHYIAKWDGTKWGELGGVNSFRANGFQQAVIADSSNNIYTAGWFSNIDGNQYVARWDGKQWSEVGGLNGLSADNIIIGLGLDKWGNVYAGGQFTIGSGKPYVAVYAQYITVKNGNWNDPATWLEGSVPPANANVIINNTVTVTANAFCASLSESIGGAVIVNSNVHLSVGD